MDRVSRPTTDVAPPNSTRSRRGRAEDFFDSNTAGRNGEPPAKEIKTARRSRSRSPGNRGLRRNDRERSASPARGSHTRSGRRRDGDENRASGRYERDRRYRSRSRDRYDRRRERSRSRERDHRVDRGGKDRDRERDRDRGEKKLAERSSGRDARHSPRRDTQKPVPSRRHTTRSTSPPAARTRTSSPKKNDNKPKPDSRKHTPLPSIESPAFGGDDGIMDVSEDNGRLDDEDENDEAQAQMRSVMGFGGFGTTKQKKVPGNNIYGVRKDKKTEYRQYMNRVGGFNRPLSPS
ncbi:MAG: hypothetical protein M1813_003121 [Trichoglossum hirsutum]|nr:MAG: hypothetical protein M1813_003121 [Trichoglossum hirsutum]